MKQLLVVAVLYLAVEHQAKREQKASESPGRPMPSEAEELER
jgi:hypothetical protein